jgi:hypothetical protein
MKESKGQKKLMENKTKSKIPQTGTEKKQWIKARQVVTKQSNAASEKDVPWGLVNKIYQNEKKAGKTIKPKEVRETKPSKAVMSYKTNATRKK